MAVGELKYLENADVGNAPGAMNVEGPSANVASCARVDRRQARTNAKCFMVRISAPEAEQFVRELYGTIIAVYNRHLAS